MGHGGPTHETFKGCRGILAWDRHMWSQVTESLIGDIILDILSRVIHSSNEDSASWLESIYLSTNLKATLDLEARWTCNAAHRDGYKEKGGEDG